LLSETDLKGWLHRSELTQLDKLLLILAEAKKPSKVREIVARAKTVGLKITSRWNPSSTLSRSKGLAINTPTGWEITEAGKSHLRTLGVTSISPAAAQVAVDLRAHLPKMSDGDTRAFVEEAIKCYELALYRSAAVMSWLAAVHVLYRHVVHSYLTPFNAEASRVDNKWKAAKTIDDLGRMKEYDFLDRIAGISMIGKSVKDELHARLKFRNGCGHPNSMKVGQNAVAAHIEALMQNVFDKFQ
jgi:hypothetical protein